MNKRKHILFLLPYKIRKEMDEESILNYLSKRANRLKSMSLLMLVLSIAALVYFSITSESIFSNWIILLSYLFNTGLFIYLYHENNFSKEDIKAAIQDSKK